MDDKRKKQLLWEYKNRKPEMGIISVYCVPANKRFLEPSRDTKADINSNSFQLSLGSHPNKELQKLWQEYGAENFEIGVFEVLPYDEKEENKDYTSDMEQLLERCFSKNKNTYLLKRRRR